MDWILTLLYLQGEMPEVNMGRGARVCSLVWQRQCEEEKGLKKNGCGASLGFYERNFTSKVILNI